MNPDAEEVVTAFDRNTDFKMRVDAGEKAFVSIWSEIELDRLSGGVQQVAIVVIEQHAELDGPGAAPVILVERELEVVAHRSQDYSKAPERWLDRVGGINLIGRGQSWFKCCADRQHAGLEEDVLGVGAPWAIAARA